MANLRRIFAVAAAAAAVSLAGQAAHSGEVSITADRDAQGRIICGTWEGSGENRQLMYTNCVYPNYPTGPYPNWPKGSPMW